MEDIMEDLAGITFTKEFKYSKSMSRICRYCWSLFVVISCKSIGEFSVLDRKMLSKIKDSVSTVEVVAETLKGYKMK